MKTLSTTHCRIDGSELTKLGSLGNLYVSDFINMNDKSEAVGVKTPLSLAIGKSGLVQLEDTADFDKMYKRYWYHSGTNMSMTNELESIVTSVKHVIKIGNGSVWVDIGCNDGTLLKFTGPEVYKVGVDPATNNCVKCRDIANVLVNDYFTAKGYKDILNGKKAKVVTAVAMFYDLPDPAKFCREVHSILEDDGVFVIQMSYLPLMVQQLAFDNICHEHLEYYTLNVLNDLLKSTGFVIRDAQVNDTNGGSIRVYVQKASSNISSFGTSPYRDVCNFRVASYLYNETRGNFNDPQTYLDFFKKVDELKTKTVDFIAKANKEGKTVWAYGASTKGNTLLQYFGLDHTMIKGIAERQEQKYGLKTIGSEIPIYSEAVVRKAKPDYMLVLPWHFIKEFCEREKDYLNSGGKFIVPCPTFEII